jgi:hypothetical protein
MYVKYLITLLLEFTDNGMSGVDLKCLLRHHVGRHGWVSEGLSLHDPLHVGTPPVLAGDEHAGGVL